MVSRTKKQPSTFDDQNAAVRKRGRGLIDLGAAYRLNAIQVAKTQRVADCVPDADGFPGARTPPGAFLPDFLHCVREIEPRSRFHTNIRHMVAIL